MIQIDDAGSGSFVGGTCIGVYRPGTNEYYFDIIPVESYNRKNFNNKIYLEDVVEIVSTAFKNMKVEKNEIIEICRGYMFSILKEWLSEQNYFWYSTQITGKIQEIVERNFELYVVSLGLYEEYIKYTKYPFHFHKLLRWVFADYESRINLCKTGWKSWLSIEGIKPHEYFQTLTTPHQFCLKCGKEIKYGCKIKVLKFISNKENFIYLHEYC